MQTSLDRIEAMIEWHFQPNQIVGRIKTRDMETMRAVSVRLAGFKYSERDRAREDAQISITLDIIKDIYNGSLSATKQLAGDNQSPDAEQAEKPRNRRGRPRKSSPKGKPEDSVGAGGPSD